MSTVKTLYPSAQANSIALACTIASLASDTNILAGRSSDAVDNTTNLDLDHLVSGVIRAGTSPTSGKQIEVWAYAPAKIASGSPTYPDVLTGLDAAKTITSANVKVSMLRQVWQTFVDSTTDRDYFIPPTSIASLFGSLPPLWALFIVHNTGVNLNSTGSNHYLHYHRIQAQTV